MLWNIIQLENTIEHMLGNGPYEFSYNFCQDDDDEKENCVEALNQVSLINRMSFQIIEETNSEQSDKQSDINEAYLLFQSDEKIKKEQRMVNYLKQVNYKQANKNKVLRILTTDNQIKRNQSDKKKTIGYSCNVYEQPQKDEIIQLIERQQRQEIQKFQRQLNQLRQSNFQNQLRISHTKKALHSSNQFIKPQTKEGLQIMECFNMILQLNNQKSLSIKQVQKTNSLQKVQQLHNRIISAVEEKSEQQVIRLKNKVEAYKSKINKKNKMIEQMNRQIQQGNRREECLQQKIIKLTEEAQLNQMKMREIHNIEIMQMQITYENKIENLREKDTAINTSYLQDIITQKQNQNIQYIQIIQNHQLQIKKIQDQHQNQIQQLTELNHEYQHQYQYLIAQLNMKITEMNQELKVKNKQAQEFQSDLKNMQLVNDELSDQIRQKILQNMDLKDRIQQLNTQINDKNEYVTSIESQIQSLQKYVDLLNNSKREMEQEQDKLQKNNKQLRAQIIGSLEREKKQKLLFDELVRIKLTNHKTQEQQKYINCDKTNNTQNNLNQKIGNTKYLVEHGININSHMRQQTDHCIKNENRIQAIGSSFRARSNFDQKPINNIVKML